MQILLAVIIFGIIIAVHEFGHFIVAKRCGIRVNEFSIGMGPAIFKKQKGETLYSLRCFPIGGFCAMEGEDEDSSDERAFNNKPLLHRIAVLVAGAFMNIVLGFILVTILTSTAATLFSTTVGGFADGAKSAQTGLMEGDKILKMNNMRIFDTNDIAYQLQTDDDGVMQMEVLRNGVKTDLPQVTFHLKQASGETKQQIVIDFKVQRLEKNFATVVQQSFNKTISIGRLIWISLVDLLRGRFDFNEISGPVGIVTAIGSAISVGENLLEKVQTLLSLASFITINVGIFNLLPLPALDGGRIFCRIIEAVIRRRINPKVEGVIHFAGLALLILLMIAVTFNDVIKLF